MQKVYLPRKPSMVTHEQWHNDLYLDFISSQYTKGGYGEPPPVTEVRNVVFAEVNYGRWIVICPAECGQAVIASLTTELFICANCGSFENNGKWYRVMFPVERQVIEELLAKRKLQNRNWKRSETVGALINENAAHGIR